MNYRAFETWGPQKGIFDIVFNPYIVTQRIPHWIHNGHGPWLGQAYANLCNVEFGQMQLAEDDSILKEPEPVVKVHELADSSVNFVVRPWVETDNYWDVYWDITRAVKDRFDAEGVSIPFPQRDIHVHQFAGA